VIGDLKVDDLLIYKLFNFFIRLTKELHLAHVFAISSDSLFIEDVHSEAMLEDRCRYLLVDDFDRETTTAFLEEYGLSDEEKELVRHHCGGKPICLVELINAEEREKKVNGMLTLRTGEIETRLKLVKELGFLIRDEIGMNEVDEVSKRYLVKENILFVDSLTTMMKPQSRLNLLAIREVMKDV
jgi:AAA+ ATPase superfamily predicted ATPase